MQGRKNDQTKLRYDLIPPEIDAAVAAVLTYGAAKYSDRDWELGMDWSRVYGALKRHMDAWWGGEEVDQETGMSHLWHAACCITFLVAYQFRETGHDDRPKDDVDPNGIWNMGVFEAAAEAAVARRLVYKPGERMVVDIPGGRIWPLSEGSPQAYPKPNFGPGFIDDDETGKVAEGMGIVAPDASFGPGAIPLEDDEDDSPLRSTGRLPSFLRSKVEGEHG